MFLWNPDNHHKMFNIVVIGIGCSLYGTDIASYRLVVEFWYAF